MPNWCFTDITIYHEDENALEDFNIKLDKWISKDYMENGFGHKWLGNIVGNSGIGTIDMGENTDIRCRGLLLDNDLCDNRLHIQTETAWTPMLLMWAKLIDKYLPGAELIFSAEEGGCGLYVTNDPDLEGKYVIDCFDYDKYKIENDSEVSEKYVKEVLQQLLNTTETDIDKLMDLFKKSDFTDGIYINKWEHSDISEWD